MTLSLLHGNALALPLADQSVHLVCTSPPYFALRSYRDGDEHFDGQLGSETTPLHFLAALWAVMDECWRVLRDDGSCWVNLGDKFAGSGGNNNAGIGGSKRGPSSYNKATGGLLPKSRMMLPHLFAEGCQYLWLRRAVELEAGLTPTVDPPQWICRMDAVWSKPNGLPESVTDRVRASHENWFHLVKSERYYAAMDEVREPQELQQFVGRTYFNGAKQEGLTETTDETGRARYAERTSNPLGKLPGSVWTVATEPLTLPQHLPQHFAAFPSYFPRRIIAGWSPSGVCTVCGEGRRPVSDRKDDSRLSDVMVEVLRRTPTSSHKSEIADFIRHHRESAGLTRAALNDAVGAGMAYEWEGQRERTGVILPTPVQWRRLAVVLDFPSTWDWLMCDTVVRQKGSMEIPGEHGRHRVRGDKTVRSSEIATITGYACACPAPTAPTTPARVLDPFSGTGTTSIVADALGRHGIGVDLSWDYHRIARWRFDDGGLRCKVLCVRKPEAELEGQLSLLGEAGGRDDPP